MYVFVTYFYFTYVTLDCLIAIMLMMMLFVCSSRVGLKLDNSQCESHCFSTNTAAQFISQSLHEGRFKPVAPIKSVTGITTVCIHVFL